MSFLVGRMRIPRPREVAGLTGGTELSSAELGQHLPPVSPELRTPEGLQGVFPAQQPGSCPPCPREALGSPQQGPCCHAADVLLREWAIRWLASRAQPEMGDCRKMRQHGTAKSVAWAKQYWGTVVRDSLPQEMALELRLE